MSKLDEAYYSASEKNLEAQKQLVNPLLYKVIGWLVDEKKWNAAEDRHIFPLFKYCMSHQNTLNFNNVSEAFRSAVYLHHSIGSRKLIDNMYSLTSSISYTVLRTFIIFAALHVEAQQ